MNYDLLEKFTRHRSNFHNLTPLPRRRQVATQEALTEQEDNKPAIKKKEHVDR